VVVGNRASLEVTTSLVKAFASWAARKAVVTSSLEAASYSYRPS
jgi:hypothetical protein